MFCFVVIQLSHWIIHRKLTMWKRFKSIIFFPRKIVATFNAKNRNGFSLFHFIPTMRIVTNWILCHLFFSVNAFPLDAMFDCCKYKTDHSNCFHFDIRHLWRCIFHYFCLNSYPSKRIFSFLIHHECIQNFYFRNIK